jgi:hypothetical protein
MIDEDILKEEQAKTWKLRNLLKYYKKKKGKINNRPTLYGDFPTSTPNNGKFNQPQDWC